MINTGQLTCRIVLAKIKMFIRDIRFNTVVLFLVLFCTEARSQLLPQNHAIVITPVYGSVTVNDKNGFFQQNLYGVDLSYVKDISRDTDAWIELSHAKSYGLSLVIRNLNNFKGYQDTSANSFGQAYGLAGEAEFELIKLGKSSINLTPAFGVSYITKDFFTNPKNRFIGSHFNMTLKADVNAEIPVGQTLSLIAGFGFVHYSNGALVIPNGGLNTADVFAGIKINNFMQAASSNGSVYKPLERNTIELSAGFGRRGIPETHDGNYKSGLYAGYNFYINDLINLKAGIDGIYYYNLKDPVTTEGKYKYYGASYKQIRSGLSAGADINLWRVSISGEAGYYIYFKRYYNNIKWYWAFGPTYYLTPHLGIRATTYMNVAQADFINWGLVVKI